MTTVINAPGLSKISPGDDVLRQLENEKARVRRRLRKAEAKLAGLKALKDDLLRRYMQAEDYQYEEERLQREVERWSQEQRELHERFSKEQSRLRREQHRLWMEQHRIFKNTLSPKQRSKYYDE